MENAQTLKQRIEDLDGRSYTAYRELCGAYHLGAFMLFIDQVQADPFAAPSRLRVRLQHDFPIWALDPVSRRVALCDFLTRQFAWAVDHLQVKKKRGSGKSGLIAMEIPGQAVLARSSVLIDGPWLEVRFRAGLPAFGRRIAGREAEAMLLREIPQIVEHSLFFRSLDREALQSHVQTNEDADALRQQLAASGLVAFVADGAILPRASGIDQRPLPGGRPFHSPDTLRMEIELPNRRLSGMGIPRGITLVVGGGYHGKSTLLQALQNGIYNHIAGDGREFVVTDPSAVKIRAEDGRYVEQVNIAPFISDLPGGIDTTRFSTDNASGSTSQAANVMEALEAGARTLIIDEDTSASNFMIRDRRMQQLVPKSREPITPFIDRAQQLFEEHGVSSLIAVGGSGSFFDIAGLVICMVDYEPHDLTGLARMVAETVPDHRHPEATAPFGPIGERHPLAASIDPFRGEKPKIKAQGRSSIRFGHQEIDLSAVEQLAEAAQVQAIADALAYARKYMDGRPLAAVLRAVMADIAAMGFDVLSPGKRGDHAAFRPQELAAALNRLRGMKVRR